MLFRRQKEFIENFETTLFESFRREIEAEKITLKNYIIDSQLYEKGIDGNGKSLGGYTRTTIRMKIAKNQPYDHVTLKDEGDFYASIYINAYDDHFEVGSDVSHEKFIFKRYTKNVLKITNENMGKFIRTKFIPNLKKQTHDELTK